MGNKRSYMFILLFVSAHFFHHLLTSIIVPLLPMIRDSFDLTYAQAGGVASAFTISYGLAQLPSGWIADRVGAKYLLFFGISGVAVAGALVGFSGTYIGLLVFLALMGVAGGGYHPSASPLVSASVEPSQRGKALGLHIVGGSASHLVSPLAAVSIAGFFGWRGSFITISVPVFLFGIVLFLLLRIFHISVKNHAASKSQDASGTAVKRPFGEIVVFLVISSAIGAVLGSVIAFIPMFSIDGLGVSQGASALFLSLYFFAGMIAAPLSGGVVDKLGSRTMFVGLAILSGPAIMLLGLSRSWIILAAVMVLQAVVMFSRMVVSETYFVTHVPVKWKSTILGIYYFAGMEGSGILTPILGRVIDGVGFSWAFTAMGLSLSIVCVVSLTILLFRNRAGIDQQAAESSN